MEMQANKHCCEPDFGLGDEVQVTTKNQRTERPSYKLDYQQASLYLVLEKKGNSYKLKLLDSIKVHLVFSPDKLWKVATDLLLGQKNDLPLLIEVNGDSKWEVDKVLASKLVHKTLKYHV